jgi:hypothetical protein
MIATHATKAGVRYRASSQHDALASKSLFVPIKSNETDRSRLRTLEAQTHDLLDAISATAINAQAGLNWLSAQPLDLEELRRALESIAKDCRRAGKVTVQLQALMNDASTADAGSNVLNGASAPSYVDGAR